MSVLKRFSEMEADYHRYQARLNYLREQRAIRQEYEEDMAEARRQTQEARQETREARQEAQEALAEIAQLKALLASMENPGGH